MHERVQKYALKTSLGMLNPSGSVVTVYPNAIKQINTLNDYYLGVKQVSFMLTDFLTFLSSNGFHQHTLDKASFSGRGIDLDLKNPITGRFMSGSSSGTALNVFLGINDVGLGTDGGGSVLAPASGLNLVGFIHPDLGNQFVDLSVNRKTSTDNISFTPSLGFISKKLSLIEQLCHLCLPQMFKQTPKRRVVVDNRIDVKMRQELSNISTIECMYKTFEDATTFSRETLIQQLQAMLIDFDVIVVKEGPIDLFGIGDTVFGHFDERTMGIQQQAGKGYIRVVNMCQAVGLVVPSSELATSYLLICKKENNLEPLFTLAKALLCKMDPLIETYFADSQKYFEHGYQS